MRTKNEQNKNDTGKVRGTTLRVYHHLIRSSESKTARAIQRDLGLSSPSLALYHLNRLIEYNLVETDSAGQYFASKVVRIGILRSYLKIGNLLVPRQIFYGIFFLSTLIFSLLFFDIILRPVDITFLIVLIVGTITSFLEAYWLLNREIEV
ncbi:MAG: helix-turn-helix transcriptional regulator [Candidatus Thorarchaeota archaeon]|nr:helix-turn-helix transcriptional regulator [Candidatus Thorarchaeota archaeon]